MTVWIFVFIIVVIMKIIPAPKSKHPSDSPPGGLPWMGNRKRQRRQDDNWNDI